MKVTDLSTAGKLHLMLFGDSPSLSRVSKTWESQRAREDEV